MFFKASSLLKKSKNSSPISSTSSDFNLEPIEPANQIEKYSEKFKSKEEALRAFIGLRDETKPVRIESFYFSNNPDTKHHIQLSSSEKMSTINSKEANKDQLNPNNFVTNALTMQKALETAYNDWNKEKKTSGSDQNTSSQVENPNQVI